MVCDGWRDTTIGKQATLQRGIDITKANQRPGKIPVISSGGVSSYHDTSAVSGPGVILGRKGVVGSVYYVDSDYWPHDTTLWVKDFHGNDPRFVYYFFKSIAPRIARMDVGSANPTLNRNHVHPIRILWPSLSEQKAIAHILGTLDDKIELNQRMNETLEAMARAIFKSWFVDFDPVRRNVDRKNGKGAKGKANRTPPESHPFDHLFPDAFEDSELGKIPKGWQVDTLAQRASNIQYGFTQSATSDAVGPRFLRITDIRGGKVDWSSVPYCEIEDAELEKYRVKDGDIFVARTGASTGDNIYVVDPPEAVFASYLVRLQFESPGVARFVAEYMRSSDYFGHIEGAIGGSAQPNASAQTLAAATTAFPPDDVATAFYDLVRPADLKRAANARESDRLAAIRNALLPKLLSGDIHIREGESVQ